MEEGLPPPPVFFAKSAQAFQNKRLKAIFDFRRVCKRFIYKDLSFSREPKSVEGSVASISSRGIKTGRPG
jgi:hypothetical protein